MAVTELDFGVGHGKKYGTALCECFWASRGSFRIRILVTHPLALSFMGFIDF